MQVPTEPFPISHQAHFHRRWNHLTDPHVRTLAWLLDAPNLLDPDAAQWQGRIATLEPVNEKTESWLIDLDRMPAALHAYLNLQPFTRLGRYAEQLMAFYFSHQKILVGHGVQVRTDKNETIGEFDFLLRRGQELVHWEFATKLYLLESSGHGRQADYFVGPNLADTLGVKIRKIMDRQLSLSRHPAAERHLPQPIVFAQALVKGWLFYQERMPSTERQMNLEVELPAGIAQAHCRGFWCPLEELDQLGSENFLVLPRLSWLAPAKAADKDVMGKTALQAVLSTHFRQARTPALVAVLARHGAQMLEVDRGFIVPDDWRNRAESRIRSGEKSGKQTHAE
ncbi:MAG TPA: DUF1853 family protein [Noviherbaspirillum sp.]|nr:DUF1853 family protein [Noviherbaspirillum sp.]